MAFFTFDSKNNPLTTNEFSAGPFNDSQPIIPTPSTDDFLVTETGIYITTEDGTFIEVG